MTKSTCQTPTNLARNLSIREKCRHQSAKLPPTNQFPSTDVDGFTLSLMRTASGMGLRDLMRQCEEALMASVDAGNCIRYFATADDIGAEGLKAHCSNLISSHWVRDIQHGGG